MVVSAVTAAARNPAVRKTAKKVAKAAVKSAQDAIRKPAVQKKLVTQVRRVSPKTAAVLEKRLPKATKTSRRRSKS